MRMRMRRRRFLQALAAAAAAPHAAAAQESGAALFSEGFSGLGSDASGYSEVVPGRVFRFPRDHGVHPGYRIEWWYLTANLEGEDGAAYGAQFTLFRMRLSPPEPDDAVAGWATPHLWMGHAALTSADDHRFAEIVARGGVGQAGVEIAPFHAWIDDWRLAAPADAPFSAAAFAPLTLAAGGEDFGYAFTLSAEKPVVLQGDGGYSVKSTLGGAPQASYYYAQPFYRLEGEITLGARRVGVTGDAWLDREWSSQPLSPEQTGWDWFALHLESGDRMMIYSLRRRDGSADLAGNWVDGASGVSTPMPAAEIQIEPLSLNRVADRLIPTFWRVAAPSRGVDGLVEALNPLAWNPGSVSYWEGPIRLSGRMPGVGYLEMTGY